ncbi:hypothetical protein LAZ67_12002748 [Cordylochernes scorpioides]|uniref:General transcription factor II-I repeat domain-containing protein 2 n=1 Tax=Cordylochernes scorpioides TaxID=51811 RepID=A0ABY6L2T1_9ARAC|nr:hypothetical protein LAZ67_12002748 [Cordylochernes scorpioides]
MRHRQFRDIIMSDNDTFNGDLPYHSKIRWLSKGQVLLKKFTLRQQIIKFFEEQKKYCDLSDKEFCRNAAFLCDMTMKQNEVNLNLQGKSQLEISKEHFPQLSEIMMEQNYSPQNMDEYVSVLDILNEEYNKRFSDFEKHVLTLKLTFEPHLVDIDVALKEYQMELFEIGEDNSFKSQFDSKKDPIEIWKTAVIYPRLRQHARRILSCFGSTYCYEATFSYMTQIKTA